MCVFADMIDRDGRLVQVSDGTICNIGKISIDVGHESGIGSDSDSVNGADLTLSPSTPSSGPCYIDPQLDLDLDSRTSTSGHMISTELLSADDVDDWRYLAERYTRELPPDVINSPLEKEFAQLVLQPPPALSADGEAEVNAAPEIDIMHFRSRPPRLLPALPTNEKRFDEIPNHGVRSASIQLTEMAPATKAEDKHEDSAELWKRAASSGVRNNRVATGNVSANATNHSSHTSSTVIHQRDVENRSRLASVATTSSQQEAREHESDRSLMTTTSEVVAIATLPRSRDRRQPISDIAPGSEKHNDHQQRVAVVKTPHRDELTRRCVDDAGCERHHRSQLDQQPLPLPNVSSSTPLTSLVSQVIPISSTVSHARQRTFSS